MFVINLLSKLILSVIQLESCSLFCLILMNINNLNFNML